MKKQYMYLIVVLAVLVIAAVGLYLFSYTGMMRCGPCGCDNSFCGGTRYYWNCTTGVTCSATNPNTAWCNKLPTWGTC